MSEDPTKKPRATKGSKKPKKPIQIVAVVTPNGIEGTFTPEPRKPLIVHLPFRSSEVEFESKADIRYDPNPPMQPEPYSEEHNLYFTVNKETEQDAGDEEGWKMAITEQLQNQEDAVKKTESSTGSPVPTSNVQAPVRQEENFTRAKVLVCYESPPGETMSLPQSTSISCYWCAHSFSGKPCFLPSREEGGTYYVYGNFCSPQCALAYLLKEHIDSHMRWERMSLLHRLYPIENGGRLYPAPPREALISFGGTMAIEEYRSFTQKNVKRIDLYQPPLVSILGVLDTKPIDFYDSSIQNTFTGERSADKFKSWSEQGGALRLKRSKPLKDKESTLDSCFNITIKRGSTG